MRANSLIPLAAPVPFVADSTVFQISVHPYGEKPAPCWLHEDDGLSFNFEKGQQNRIRVGMSDGKVTIDRQGTFKPIRYNIDPTPQKEPRGVAASSQPNPKS